MAKRTPTKRKQTSKKKITPRMHAFGATPDDPPLSPALQKTEDLVGGMLAGHPFRGVGLVVYLCFLAFIGFFFYSIATGGDSDEVERARKQYENISVSPGDYVLAQPGKYSGTPFFLDKLFTSTTYYECARIIGEEWGVFMTPDGSMLHPGQRIYDDTLNHKYVCG